MPAFAQWSTAFLASLSTQADFILRLALVAQQALAPPAAFGRRCLFGSGGGNHRCRWRGRSRRRRRSAIRCEGRRFANGRAAARRLLRTGCGGGIFSRRQNRLFLDRRRIGGSALVGRRTIPVLDRALEDGLRAVFAGAECRLAIALPVAAAAPSSASTPATPFARLALGSFLTRLRMRQAFFFGRAGVMILMLDRVLGSGVMRECLYV